MGSKHNNIEFAASPHVETAILTALEHIGTSLQDGQTLTEHQLRDIQFALSLFRKPLYDDFLNNIYETPKYNPKYTLRLVMDRFFMQERRFMTDCLPTIQRLLRGYDLNETRHITFLDVGARTAAGTSLFADLHPPWDLWNKVGVKVDALDLDPRHKKLADYLFPNVNYIVADIFKLDPDRKWNIINCSHTIEHFPDPVPFIEELCRRAIDWVVLYAPYREEAVVKGHHRIDDDLIDRFNPVSQEIIRSFGWRHVHDEDPCCILFVIEGLASSATNS